MPFDIGPWEVVILLAVLALLFGSKGVPDVARRLGTGLRELKDALGESTRAACSSPARTTARRQPETAREARRVGGEFNLFVGAMSDGELVDVTRRTRLAAERTWLAWWRSGIAAATAALAVGGLVPQLIEAPPGRTSRSAPGTRSHRSRCSGSARCAPAR